MLESDGGKEQGIRRRITTWHVTPLGSNENEPVCSPLMMMMMMIEMGFRHHLLCFC